MSMKTFFNNTFDKVKNKLYGPKVNLLMKICDFTLQIFLFCRIKIPSETVSKSHSSVLYKALLVIKDRYYNYGFGLWTFVQLSNYIYLSCQELRFIFATLLLPTIIQHSFNLNSASSSLQVAMGIYDIFCLCDVVNTTQNQITYNILMIIRFIRIISTLIQIIQLFHQILRKKEVPIQIKVQQPKKIQEQSSESTSSSNQFKLNENNGFQSIVLKKQILTNSDNKNKIKQMIFPKIQIKIKSDLGYENHELDDPYQFDQVFNRIKLEKNELLHIKLFYCNEIYKRLKKLGKKSEKYKEYFLSQIAEINSQLLLQNLTITQE